jgi:hypothetical protein
MKTFSSIIFIVLLLTVQLFSASMVRSEERTVDNKKIERLERLIKAQQQQLEYLQQQVNQLKNAASEAQTGAKSAAKDAKKGAPAPVGKVVTSGGGQRVHLAISGQVNRAVNVVDDGKSTKAYFVDNDNSESRVRFDGTARATDDMTLGTRIELSIAPNKAGEVNQDDEETNNIFDQRWTELFLDSKRFGKLSLGKGATSS